MEDTCAGGAQTAGDKLGKGLKVQISLVFSGDCELNTCDYTMGFGAEKGLDQ